jgi:CRP-like cAMP-binding protein
MNTLLSLLSSIYPLTPELRRHLESTLKTRHIRKKDFILQYGQICKYVFFVEKGIFRCFYEYKEKEISSWFMKEGDLFISVESFFTQKPSYEAIQALEDSEVYYISYDQLQYIFRTYLEFNFIARVLVEKYYRLCDQRLYFLKMKSVEDRFAYLMENHSDLMLRVSATHIASYLAITLDTLGRIKKRGMKKIRQKGSGA